MLRRPDLNITITSAGTLEAISTIDVGTQVSGKISKLFADYNSEVKKGELLAVIDTTNLLAQVRDAEANLAKVKAEYNQKVVIHERNKKLYEKKYISELDFIQSETDLESAKASLSSAESSLDRAKTNLGYAYIYSPISGKIINRSVEEGQTVAASLSAPTLFTIANDLHSMKILASVDESDIGQIKTGQKVTFTVQAYTDKKFDGIVSQIRLQPTISSNVVNYTVVVNATNNANLLLPGMTATVDFFVDHRENVLLIPNTALRVELPEDLKGVVRENMKDQFSNSFDSIKSKFVNQETQPNMPYPSEQNKSNINSKNSSIKTVYYKNNKGKILLATVLTGLTDGKNTEITRSRELADGTNIIVVVSSESTSGNKNTSIISNSGQQGMPPPPMM